MVAQVVRSFLQADNRVARHSKVARIYIAWTSATGGGFTQAVRLSGTLRKVVTKPSATVAPTDDYDITLVGPLGEDAFGGKCIDRDDTNTETVVPFLSGTLTEHPIVVEGIYTLTIANAGDEKQGEIEIYLE